MSETLRIEQSRQEYIKSKPSICYERASIWTEFNKKTEGEPIEIRRAKAFLLILYNRKYFAKLKKNQKTIGTF